MTLDSIIPSTMKLNKNRDTHGNAQQSTIEAAETAGAAPSNPNSPTDSINSTFRNEKKGLYEWLIFGAAILTGTACSILSKVLYETKDENGHYFNKPIAQTLAMFLAMILGLPIHWLVIYRKLPFPGYDRFCRETSPSSSKSTPTTTPLGKTQSNEALSLDDYWRFAMNPTENFSHDEEMQHLITSNPQDGVVDDTRIPLKTYFYLFLPSLFDCLATVLCMIGLLFLDVSIYQLLRGSGIIFVAILRQYYLQEHLYKFQWTGVAWNVASVMLVGATALLDSSSPTHERSNLEQAIVGIAFMLAGSLVQSMMFVFEEKVMNLDEIKVPPLLLFGMEGLWGTVITVCFLYPIGFYAFGDDYGSFENPWHTWKMIESTPSIQILLALYCMAIFGYNLFAVLVTFSLSSVWHSILDNFRPMSVWIIDLFIFYILTGSAYGEPWTKFSWIQLVGLVILVYGTMIYNAPDDGSVTLRGEWYSFGLDFSEEYREILTHRYFSMGSYPSIHHFLAASGRSRRDFDSRMAMSMRESGSPKIHYGTLFEQNSI